jgi:hypothetical protein
MAGCKSSMKFGEICLSGTLQKFKCWQIIALWWGLWKQVIRVQNKYIFGFHKWQRISWCTPNYTTWACLFNTLLSVLLNIYQLLVLPLLYQLNTSLFLLIYYWLNNAVSSWGCSVKVKYVTAMCKRVSYINESISLAGLRKTTSK